jgi:flagellar biosynthetic protein FliR
MTLALDAGWATGLLFAIARVAGFVIASPIFPRAVPMVGRIVVVLALGFFLSAPVDGQPDIADLIGGGVTNAAVGIALGFLTGLIFHMFAVAGGLVDFSAGLLTGATIDPVNGEQSAVFQRMFSLGAIVLFYVLGGLRLVAEGLALSVHVIALDGGISPSGDLADLALRLVVRLVVAGVEIALPALAALFLIEVVLGIASRFAPQANVFMLGLPLKMLAAFGTVGIVLLLFPEAVNGATAVVSETFAETLGVLGG